MNVFRLLNAAPMPEQRRLRLRRWLLDRAFERERARVTKLGGRVDDLWEEGSWQYDYYELEDDEARYHSRHLLDKARSLRIPIPSVFEDDGRLSKNYKRSDVDGHRFYLSMEGEQLLRAGIREEEGYRAEARSRSVVYITALSGLIGTVSGLIAVIAK